MHKLKCHAEQEPTSLLSLRDDVPAELQDIVAKMMKKAPDQRFQTPDEVSKALKHLLSTYQPVVQPSRPRSDRWPWIAVASMLIAAMFAATVFYVATDNGIVRVEVLDESLEVTLANQTIHVADGSTKFTIRAGDEQQLIVRHKDAELEFETERFRIRRGQEIVFKVDSINGEIVVQQDGVSFDRAPLLVGEWIGAAPFNTELHLAFNSNAHLRWMLSNRNRAYQVAQEPTLLISR